MIRLRNKNILFLLSCLLVTFSINSVQAETTECIEILKVPITINAQGVYCFKANRTTSMTSGNAITINTNNVTIDFNDFKLGGLAAGTSTRAHGVHASNRKNITLRNANIRGFSTGIFIDDSDFDFSDTGGHLIENSRFDGNTYRAIYIEGTSNTVRNNHIKKTGGSTRFDADDAYAIASYGPNARILNNFIDQTTAKNNGASYGIWVSYATANIIMQNQINETLTDTGKSYGIYRVPNNGNRVLIKGNTIINGSQPIYYGIRGGGTAEATCINNDIINSSLALISCYNSDVAPNTIRP